MATIAQLVARSGELKRELVRFARRPRYTKAFQESLVGTDGRESVVADQGQMILAMDHFALQYRLADGQTVVEKFVTSRPDLPAAEREMLLGWRDVVEGIFEVERRDGDVLVVSNLIDDLNYRVHSNLGPAVFDRMPRRSFLITRLVPVAGDWLISGATNLLPANHREYMYRNAVDVALRHPERLFRNPDKLAQAWDAQRSERGRFVSFFGTDLVVVPGEQLADQLGRYMEFSRKEVAAALSAPDQERRANVPVPEYPLNSDLREAETVGVIFDEVEGLNFFVEFGLVEAVFADPTLLGQPRYEERLRRYLDHDSVSPLPFHRLADRDTERASVLFQKLLGRPDFDWLRDGEDLLRDHKAAHFDRPPRPSTSPISERLVPYAIRT